jgi:hypothetical protein
MKSQSVTEHELRAALLYGSAILYAIITGVLHALWFLGDLSLFWTIAFSVVTLLAMTIPFRPILKRL